MLHHDLGSICKIVNCDWPAPPTVYIWKFIYHTPEWSVGRRQECTIDWKYTLTHSFLLSHRALNSFTTFCRNFSLSQQNSDIQMKEFMLNLFCIMCTHLHSNIINSCFHSCNYSIHKHIEQPVWHYTSFHHTHTCNVELSPTSPSTSAHALPSL